jgi:hypothetical protein
MSLLTLCSGTTDLLEPEFRASKIMLSVTPDPNTTINLFIGGPHLSTRTLGLPDTMLQEFLHKYQGNIRKAARRIMEIYPPASPSRAASLCLTEKYTETWKTFNIRSDSLVPVPLYIGWKGESDDAVGSWTIFENSCPGIVVSGGFGSCEVPDSKQKRG